MTTRLASIFIWIPLSTLPAQQISAIRSEAQELQALMEQRGQMQPEPSAQTRGQLRRWDAPKRWTAESRFLAGQANLWGGSSELLASTAKRLNDLREHPDAFTFEEQLRGRRTTLAQRIESLLAVTAPKKRQTPAPTDIAELRSLTFTLKLVDEELAATAAQQKAEKEERGRLERNARLANRLSVLAGAQRDRLQWGQLVTAEAAIQLGGRPHKQSSHSSGAWKSAAVLLGVGGLVAAGVVLKDPKR